MNITPYTKLIALFGHPVEHSLSPKMHNEIYRQQGMDLVYAAFDVSPDRLGQAVEGARAMGFLGFNATIPHKEAVIPYLDAIDHEARIIGAVNTVKNDNGKLVGYNTDGMGFIYSLQRKGVSCRGKKVMLLGAGGAARAIGVYIAKEAPESIHIYNRTVDRGRVLANLLNEYTGSNISETTAKISGDADIIINTTSLGMWPHVEGNPMEGYPINPAAVVCDIVYNPRETRLLRQAKERNCQIIEGIDMLVGQGIKAIEIWTGIKLDDEVHRNIL